MRYTKFTITNFKGIKDTLTVELDKTSQSSNIYTLVGLNESGKSSILEAIKIIQNPISDESAFSLIHKSQIGFFTGRISVKAELELDESDEKRIKDYCKSEFKFKITQDIKKITIEKVYVFDKTYKDRENLWVINLKGKLDKGTKEVSLASKDKEKWSQVVRYIESSFFPRILYYENFLFNFPKRIYLEVKDGEGDEQAEYRKVFQDILNSIGGDYTIELILEMLKKGSQETNAIIEGLKEKVAEKLTKTIFQNWGEIFETSKKEIRVIIGKDDPEGLYYLELKVKQGSDSYHISERSLGFRWFFSFLLFTEFRKQRNNEYGEILFLLDEPASNLHQKAQQKLLKLFEKISENSKIIYSTHSHHLIEPKFLSGTYIVRNKAINYEEDDLFNETETDIACMLYKKFVANYPNDTEGHYQPILDSLEYTPSSLELVEKIICLEGKNDYYTLRYFSESLGYEDLHFYPGSSVSNYEGLFRQYLSWGKKFLALFDGDKKAMEEKKRYIKDISIELEYNIFCLNELNSNWGGFVMEDLFTKDDKIKIIQTTFSNSENYDKSKFNTSLQNIFITKEAVTFSTETIDNFKTVLTFLREKIKTL